MTEAGYRIAEGRPDRRKRLSAMRPRDRKRPARPNATGRNDRSGRFVMMSYRLLESAAYASLDLTARALLQELVMLYKGDNNGSLYLSALDATARLGLSKKRPALRAFNDLQDRGFITMAKDAHFAIKAGDVSRALLAANVALLARMPDQVEACSNE